MVLPHDALSLRDTGFLTALRTKRPKADVVILPGNLSNGAILPSGRYHFHPAAVVSRPNPSVFFFFPRGQVNKASLTATYSTVSWFPFLHVLGGSPLPQPNRLRLVTVFRLHRCAETREGLAIRYRRLGVFRIASRGEYGHRQRMAAEAWVRCEGPRRRAKLIELNAPEPLVRQVTDARAIAAEIKPAPSGFGDDEAYVYDNGVESWLMLISYHTLPAPGACPGVHDIQRGDRFGQSCTNGGASWSRWFPSQN